MNYDNLLAIDPKFLDNIANTPSVLGGFVIKLVFSDIKELSVDQFLNLFYTSHFGDTSTWIIRHFDDSIYIPAWFIRENTQDETIFYIRFYVPIIYTTNNVYGFGIMYYNPEAEAQTELEKLQYLTLSNRGSAEGSDYLHYNQGKFNEGWNSIKISLSRESLKCTFTPILDFTIFDSNSINSETISKEYKELKNIFKYTSRSTLLASQTSTITTLDVLFKNLATVSGPDDSFNSIEGLLGKSNNYKFRPYNPVSQILYLDSICNLPQEYIAADAPTPPKPPVEVTWVTEVETSRDKIEASYNQTSRTITISVRKRKYEDGVPTEVYEDLEWWLE